MLGEAHKTSVDLWEYVKEQVLSTKKQDQVDDYTVQDEEKQDRFWKVRPFFNRIRDGCLQNHRSKVVCIDEQMIPFYSQVRM